MRMHRAVRIVLASTKNLPHTESYSNSCLMPYSQDHLLPPEYVLTMRAQLLDKCPLNTYKEVAAIVTADLGASPEQLYASFDPVPIASASLAQVRAFWGNRSCSLAHRTWLDAYLCSLGVRMKIRFQLSGQSPLEEEIKTNMTRIYVI